MAARDLKLENVLVDAQGSAPGRPIVKLGDFNLSTMSRRPATASLVSEAGRPCYFAPEMLTTRGEYYAKVGRGGGWWGGVHTHQGRRRRACLPPAWSAAAHAHGT